MKKVVKKVALLLIVFGIGVGVTLLYMNNKYKVYEEEEPKQIKKHVDTISMMLETEANSGNYEMTTRSEWPTEGYVFNSELSKCEHGSELSWDDTNKRVVMSGNVPDKCYVYFDIKPQVLLADYVKSLYTGTQGANYIYYHDASLTNGANDNSYRFAGASDVVNNYVCFGSTTPCPTDNLYRIIGVFGDKVKLIKADYATTALLGGDGDYKQAYTATGYSSSSYKGNNLANVAAYTWNYKNDTSINSGKGSNTWSTSLLNKTNLNQNFITKIGADWAAKIATTTWKVGGNTYDNIQYQPAKTAYQNEIVSPVTTNTTDNATTYSAKIGLMYASDYGFAASPSAWTASLNTYNGEAIKNVNWMYMGLYEWTVSRIADDAYVVFYVYNTGFVNNNSANFAIAVRPVFYLTSSVNYASGSGSATDPISIN